MAAPIPFSTASPAPNDDNFFTVSGTIGARRSSAAFSLGTKICIAAFFSRETPA
jgi:hypothetical protein